MIPKVGLQTTVRKRGLSLPKQQLSPSRLLIYGAATHQQYQQSFNDAELRPPQRRVGPQSKHSLFYRELYPPLLRCLAYGSGIYFALHLAWQYLDGEEQNYLEEQQTSQLASKIKELRSGAIRIDESADSDVKQGLLSDEPHGVAETKNLKSW